MAKAKVSEEQKLIEGLLKALGGQPMPQVTAKGQPLGIFPPTGGQKLSQRAIELGYLEECDGPPLPPPTLPKKRGAKSPKPIPYARITSKGREWVLQQVTPIQALESLRQAIQKRNEILEADGGEIADLRHQLGLLQQSFDQVRQGIQDAVTRQREDVNHLSAVIHSVTDSMKRLINMTYVPTSGHEVTDSPDDLDREIESFVAHWQQHRPTDCPLPDLHKHLKEERFPNLSIGVFHDRLRSLHQNNRIRLTGWGGSPADIPKPELALFISNKVMYYAHDPSRIR